MHFNSQSQKYVAVYCSHIPGYEERSCENIRMHSDDNGMGHAFRTKKYLSAKEYNTMSDAK